MQSEHANERDEQSRSRLGSEERAHGASALAVGDRNLLTPALLSDRGMFRQPNSEVRASAMRQVQRTHGNRAVQRYLSVQRCGPTPCGCSAEERARKAVQHRLEGGAEMTAQRRLAVQRLLPALPAAPAPFSPAPAQGTSPDPRHTPGDAWWGPNHPSLSDPNAPRIGPSPVDDELGGITSYGCYCGAGGTSTGSRCGPGAPAVDAIDEQCRQHDLNYGARRIDSGSTPGTYNMFSTLEGWLHAREPDRLLADQVGTQLDTSPSSFTPTSHLYGRGLQGVFYGRANVADAMEWGLSRGHRAETGISSFVSSASTWSTPGDVITGVAGGARDAASFVGETAQEAYRGVAGAAPGAMEWAGNMGRAIWDVL